MSIQKHEHEHLRNMSIVCRNDTVAVDIKVKQWLRQRGSRSCVRYYKKVGERNSDTRDSKDADFKPSDFLLVFQSEDQSQILSENPRTLCVDGTHGLTAYQFFLLTIMVINRYGKGLPVAWAISSRENAHVWKILGRSLRTSSLTAKPEVMMSDDDNSAWNGLTQVWTSLRHKLLCHWHIWNTVRDHCFGSKCKVQMQGKDKGNNVQEANVLDEDEPDFPDYEDVTACVTNSKFTYDTPIYEMFYSMMKETNKETFYAQLEVFLKTCRAYNQVF